MNKKYLVITLILIGLIIVVGVVVFISVSTNNTNKSVAQNENISNSMLSDSNTNSPITPSKKRAGATEEQKYETKASGERCAVVDLNDYEPTKNIATKTYEWIIKFPPDDCVIQKPATNLPETLSDMKSDTIQGTELRKIIVSYQ